MNEPTRVAITFGALGGIVPVFISLVTIDAEAMLVGADAATIIGYTIRAVALAALGTILVAANKETDRLKALQLGIAAPAIMVGYMQANNVERQLHDEAIVENPSAAVSHDRPPTLMDWMIASSHADEPELILAQSSGIHNRPAPSQKLWYGLTGKMKNRWFVIAGAHTSRDGANDHAAELEEQGYRARVLKPSGDHDTYRVAIGSHLELDEARALRRQAIDEGVLENPRLASYPRQ